MNRRPDLVCDIFLPQNRFAEFWASYCRVFDFWPLWVDASTASVYPWLGPHVRAGFAEGDLFIDFAVYGKRNVERTRDYSVLLEDETYDLGGIKTLIGRNHYAREHFWEIYDRPAYEAARAALDPGGLFPGPLRQAGPRRLTCLAPLPALPSRPLPRSSDVEPGSGGFHVKNQAGARVWSRPRRAIASTISAPTASHSSRSLLTV